jgi:hypothetical protein
MRRCSGLACAILAHPSLATSGEGRRPANPAPSNGLLAGASSIGRCDCAGHPTETQAQLEVCGRSASVLREFGLSGRELERKAELQIFKDPIVVIPPSFRRSRLATRVPARVLVLAEWGGFRWFLPYVGRRLAGRRSASDRRIAERSNFVTCGSACARGRRRPRR